MFSGDLNAITNFSKCFHDLAVEFMFNKFQRNQFPAWGNFLTKFPNYSQTGITLWNPASRGRLLIGHTRQLPFSHQGNRSTVPNGMFDARRPGSCKHVYFCCLLLSFSRGGCQVNQDMYPPLKKVIEELSTVNSPTTILKLFSLRTPL